MATPHYSPLPGKLEERVSYKEASALFADTEHPAAARTIALWVQEANRYEETIPVMRVGRTDYVSWTALLKEHARRTAAKLRASSNWP